MVGHLWFLLNAEILTSFCHVDLHLPDLKNLRSCGSSWRFYIKHLLDHSSEVTWILSRKWWIDTSDDLVAKLLHGLSSERWMKGCQFIDDTAQTPNVAAISVWLVLPNLRWGVVWSASLCVHEASLLHLGHIEVTELDYILTCEEYVCTLEGYSLTFKSLWQIFLSCRHLIPCKLCIRIDHSSFSENQVLRDWCFSTFWSRSPPDANSMTMHKVLVASSKNASL